jgi:hypothetical protein
LRGDAGLMTRRATVFARAEVTRIVIEALAAGQELADRGLTECAGETRCEMRLGAGQEAGVKARLPRARFRARLIARLGAPLVEYMPACRQSARAKKKRLKALFLVFCRPLQSA